MRESTHRIPGGSVGAAILIALLIAPLVVNGTGQAGAPDPGKLFLDIFRPVEEAMGIDIELSGVKLHLLSGEVVMGRISSSHSEQGDVLVARDVHFPFAALLFPDKAHARVEEVDLRVDLSGERFWVVDSENPIPGAPDLNIQYLDVLEGDAAVAGGAGSKLEVDGFRGRLVKMKLPGDKWSQGKVPDCVWAKARIDEGDAHLAGLPWSLTLSKASCRFKGNVFHLDKLRGELPDGGTVSLSGKVVMAGGSPSRYELDLGIDGAIFSRPWLDGTVSGDLEVAGKPGKVKITGTLGLADGGKMAAGSWSLDECTREEEIAIEVVAGDGSEGRIEGTVCEGKLVVD